MKTDQSNEVSQLLVRNWDGTVVTEQNYPVKGVAGKPLLKGSIIDKTLVSHSSVSTCIKVETGYSCPDDKVKITKPTPLPLCRENASYPRNSYEGVAVTSLFHLERAYEYFTKISDAEINLNSVNLFILPRVERNIMNEYDPGVLVEKVLENNLSYIDDYYQRPSFMVHPTKIEDDPNADLTKLNLWESSWALSHEFGHHVLTSITGLTSAKIDSLSIER